MQDDYYNIVKDILTNDEFCKLKNEKHHIVTNRYNHSIMVSKRAYKISKKLKLDYISTARGSLMHDFFLNEEYQNKKEQLKNHPTKALENAKNITKINDIEKDIILSHMYPVTGTKPVSKEAIIVDLVDDLVTFREVGINTCKKVALASNFAIFVLINFFKL